MSLRNYTLLLLLVALGLSAATEVGSRVRELSCWPAGYAQNAWMAYCNSERYGVFDPDAIWFNVEPKTTAAIRDARVLTLSNSRLQNALSLGGGPAWFTAHGYPAYFLGVPGADSGFGERLIDRFKLHPDVIIFDTSPYFTGALGSFEDHLASAPDEARAEVASLEHFQHFHRRYCTLLPWACGHNFAYFRSATDGHWIFPAASPSIWIGRDGMPNNATRFPVDSLADETKSLYPTYLANARRLAAKLAMPSRCIVITHVPSDEPGGALAKYIAEGLDASLVSPQVAGLATFDHAHLTPDSAQRWTADFLHDLAPVLQSCVPSVPAQRTT
jgi:hypothetical protein